MVLNSNTCCINTGLKYSEPSPRKSKNQNPLKLAYKTAEILLAQNIACSSHNISKVSCTFFLSLDFSVSSSYLEFNFLFWI